jgi:adenine-specific DNA-methyltransferase
MEKMTGKSMDLVAENIAQLKVLFPEAVTEGKIDFEVLKALLGGEIEKRQTYYKFTWNGKEESRAYARIPSMGTLRPCVEESSGKDGTPGKFDSENLYIEGDNLEVLKLLQGPYHKRVKMIYIDPPYNTGKDFVYPDNFRDSISNYKALTGQTDAKGASTRANPETSGRYHTDWLNMMYPRLILARNLLTDDGVIFISIDDTELANLQAICNDVFGEENFIDIFNWAKTETPENLSKKASKL